MRQSSTASVTCFVPWTSNDVLAAVSSRHKKARLSPLFGKPDDALQFHPCDVLRSRDLWGREGSFGRQIAIGMGKPLSPHMKMALHILLHILQRAQWGYHSAFVSKFVTFLAS